MTIVRVTSGGIPVTESPNGLPYEESTNGFGIPVTFVPQGGAPLGSAAGNVNDARYSDYIAFIDPRANLVAIPDGLGGKRRATLSEFWLTPANASFDSSLYGVRDLVLSAQTTVSTAITALLNVAEATIVFESYGRVTADRMIRPNAGGNLALLLAGGANARMTPTTPAPLDCTRRRGDWTDRFRIISAWSAAGRSISFNGGETASDTTQPDARTSPNFLTGRYSFIGIKTTRDDQWSEDNSFTEPTAVCHGDSMMLGDSDLGRHMVALSALLPGNPPMENMGVAGETGAQIETRFLSENAGLKAKRWVWGGHNSYDSTDWKTRVANMIANTNGGLANFALNPTFPSVADDAPVLADKAAMHQYFKDTYGPHYLHELLDNVVALGAPGQAYEDPTSYALGVPPAGLRFDNLHLNPTCNETIIAPLEKEAFARLGWRY